MKKILLIPFLGLLIAGLLLACTATSTKQGGKSSSPAAQPAQPSKPAGKVDILSHTGSINEIGAYQVDGEVQNSSGQKAAFVKVTATFYDANKKVIDTNFTYTEPTDLEPGQKAPFKVYNTKTEISGSIASYDLAVSHQ